MSFVTRGGTKDLWAEITQTKNEWIETAYLFGKNQIDVTICLVFIVSQMLLKSSFFLRSSRFSSLSSPPATPPPHHTYIHQLSQLTVRSTFRRAPTHHHTQLIYKRLFKRDPRMSLTFPWPSLLSTNHGPKSMDTREIFLVIVGLASHTWRCCSEGGAQPWQREQELSHGFRMTICFLRIHMDWSKWWGRCPRLLLPRKTKKSMVKRSYKRALRRIQQFGFCCIVSRTVAYTIRSTTWLFFCSSWYRGHCTDAQGLGGFFERLWEPKWRLQNCFENIALVLNVHQIVLQHI